MKTWFASIPLILLSACGSSPSSTPAEGPIVKDSSKALALDSVQSLPACDASREDQLVYLIANKEFRTCNSGTWIAITIEGQSGKDGQDGSNGKDGKDGADGLRITSIWTYEDSSYTADDYLSESDLALIGDIRLIVFSDGSHNLTVSGQTLDTETSGDVSYNDFTHTFFMPKGMTTESMKLTTYANAVAYYGIGYTKGSPFVTATLDTDNNINNNVLTDYLLIKAWPN
jgi:hypothetical protein